MFAAVLAMMGCFFCIGALLTAWQNRHAEPADKKRRWQKYGFYLLTVNLCLFSIQWNVSPIFFGIILVIGCWELIYAGGKGSEMRGFQTRLLLLYALLAFCFLQFGRQVASERQLWLYGLIFSFDGFSQLAGQLLGGRKLIPKISPQKTWSGLLLGTLMALAAGYFLKGFLSSSRPVDSIIPLLLCVTAFCGDALASWVKRRFQIKDYSQLIPQHGGVLDRFDSLIFSGALYWILNLGNH